MTEKYSNCQKAICIWHIWPMSTREKHIRCFNFQMLHCLPLLICPAFYFLFGFISQFYEQYHKNTSSSTFSHFLLFPQASVDLRMYFRPPEHSLKHQIKSGIILFWYISNMELFYFRYISSFVQFHFPTFLHSNLHITIVC